MIASMPPSTASRPYLPIISRKRRSPVFTAAIWARKSPIARSGRRTLVLDDRDELLVRHALAIDLHDRHLQAFGVDVGGGAVERAADVRPMRHAAGERHHLAVVEDRHRECHVIEMAAGDVGVVGQQDVAGIEILHAVVIELGLHGVAHAADEHRQAEPDRHRIALRVEQPDGEIERLVDDHVVGGAHQVGLHLLGRGDETVAHDFGGDRIDARQAARAWPSSAASIVSSAEFRSRGRRRRRPSSTSPGCTTVVEAYSSISAGPAMRLPAEQRAR